MCYVLQLSQERSGSAPPYTPNEKKQHTARRFVSVLSDLSNESPPSHSITKFRRDPSNAKRNNLEWWWYRKENILYEVVTSSPTKKCTATWRSFLSCRLAKSWRSFKSILCFNNKTYCDITDQHRTNLRLYNQTSAHHQSVTGLALADLLCHYLPCCLKHSFNSN